MLIAIRDGERVEATPKAAATCQECERPVRAKCGAIMIWHWAHHAKDACEASRYGMTEWHLSWLSRFPKEIIEQRLEWGGVRHIADVIVVEKGRKIVLEFQRKMMPIEMMKERESFWRMAGYGFLWVFDARDAYQKDRLTYNKLLFKDRDGHQAYSLRWRQAPGRIVGCNLPWLIDDGNSLLRVVKFHTDERPYGGYGYELEYKETPQIIQSMLPV